MTSPLSIFLDDGGVMNDNTLRAPQWQRLVGEFLAPRLGGEPQVWARANRVVAEEMWEEYKETRWGRDHLDFLSFYERDRVDRIRRMCHRVGVATIDEPTCLRLEQEKNAYVTRRVHAAYPGVVDAIRLLRDHGHPLLTASGEASADLEGYLQAMKVRALFRRLYGPDLVNIPKEGAVFYRRIFADAGVEPHTALVVDDMELAVGWATEAGAIGVLVSADEPQAKPPYAVVRSLAELPAAVERIESDRTY